MIGFLLFDGMEELDFAGPWEIFSVWNDHFGGPLCVSLDRSMEPVTCRYGLRVLPDMTVGRAPDLSALIVPGGEGSKAVVEADDLLAFVREVHKSGADVLSVCTGARVLAAAGLLNGKTVTTHHSARDEAATWPGVTVSPGRYVQDGTVWSSAGVTAGMDLALAYVATRAGEQAADEIRHFIEWERSEGK